MGMELRKILAALESQQDSLSHVGTDLIGPTVCEDEGPIPMEKRSNVEMTACSGRMVCDAVLTLGFVASDELARAPLAGLDATRCKGAQRIATRDDFGTALLARPKTRSISS